MNRQTILVIDDDAAVRAFVTLAAERCNIDAHGASCVDEIVVALDRFDPDLVLLDLVLAESDGIEIMGRFADRCRNVPVLLMSGMDGRTLRTARRFGEQRGLKVCGVIAKPFTPTHLISEIERALEENAESTSRAGVKSSASPTCTPEELVAGLSREEFVLHYQPKIDIRSRECVGVEALVRWNHPVHGFLMPGAFVEIAESSGRIVDLSRWVARRALRDLAGWRTKGLDLRVAINVTARDLEQPRYAEEWRDMLSEHGLAGSDVVLEIVERQAMTDQVHGMGILSRLRFLGMGLSIDDFGTGFSSISFLHEMPFTELKIDRGFVTRISDDPDARVITRSILGLGHGLGMQVVAEGVEDERGLEALQYMGCNMAQGYLIGRPMPAAGFLEWLATRQQRFVGASRERPKSLRPTPPDRIFASSKRDGEPRGLFAPPTVDPTRSRASGH